MNEQNLEHKPNNTACKLFLGVRDVITCIIKHVHLT